jgi:hypothetical protein
MRAVAVAAAFACAVAQPVVTAAPAHSELDPKGPLPEAVLAAEEALPDEVRHARYREQLERSIAWHEAWGRAFEASGRGVAGLPVVEDPGHLNAPLPTFAAAADAADAIVRATVLEHRHAVTGTYATLRVHEVVSRTVLPAKIEAGIVGYPTPGDEGEALLAVPWGELFLHVGTEAVLLLEHDGSGWSVQLTTGTYVVGADRRVRTATTSPFGAAYQGMALPDLLAALRAEA